MVYWKSGEVHLEDMITLECTFFRDKQGVIGRKGYVLQLMTWDAPQLVLATFPLELHKYLEEEHTNHVMLSERSACSQMGATLTVRSRLHLNLVQLVALAYGQLL